MPQLDTIYTFMTYLWTWLVFYLTTQKIMMYTMTEHPSTNMPNKTPPTMQWL